MPSERNEPQFNANKPVTVPMWVVVYAVRYGIRRQSYAKGDALRLAAIHWDNLDDATRRDVEEARDGS